MDIKDLMADRLKAIDDQRAKDMQEFAKLREVSLERIRFRSATDDLRGVMEEVDAGVSDNADWIRLVRAEIAIRTLVADWSLIRWTVGLGTAVYTPSGEWILIRPAAIDHPDYPALKPGDIVPDNYKLIPTASDNNA